MAILVIFLNATAKGPQFPENGLTKKEMMSFLAQFCLMHKEAYVLSWKEEYHIDGRCQAAQGGAESEIQNHLFLSRDIVWCLCTVSLREGCRTACNGTSHCVDELLLPREKSLLNMKKRPRQKLYCIPASGWLVESLAWLHTSEGGLTVHGGFFLTISIPRLGSARPGSRRPGSRGYTRLLLLPWASARSCFTSCASEARRGGGDHSADLAGG